MPRSVRLSGAVVLVVGVWAAVAPFVGPLLGLAPDGVVAWTWTTQHWQLSLAPGAVAAVAGVTLLAGGAVEAWVAKVLAYVAGVWLVIGPLLSGLWSNGTDAVPLELQSASQAAIVLGYFSVPGLVVVTAVALAVGRRVADVAVSVAADDEAPLWVGQWS